MENNNHVEDLDNDIATDMGIISIPMENRADLSTALYGDITMGINRIGTLNDPIPIETGYNVHTYSYDRDRDTSLFYTPPGESDVTFTCKDINFVLKDETVKLSDILKKIHDLETEVKDLREELRYIPGTGDLFIKAKEDFEARSKT